MTPDPRLEVFANHRTVRKYKAVPLEPGHLEQILWAAQRAPTDATAQMYSFVRLTDPALREEIAKISNNPHMATASETFIILADVSRLKKLLEFKGYSFAEWSAEFDCDEGRERELAETIGGGVFQGGFDALKRHFGRR